MVVEMITAIAKFLTIFFEKCSSVIVEICVDLAKALHALVVYIYWLKERVKDAVIQSREASKRLKEEQFILETVNAKDCLQGLDDAWNYKYKAILEILKTKDTTKMVTDILSCVYEGDKPCVIEILKKVDSLPEYKATEIIKVMRGLKANQEL